MDHAYSNVRLYHSAGCIVADGWLSSESGFRQGQQYSARRYARRDCAGVAAPPVPDNASPLDFLHAARDALAHGKTGQAQEALERAEARALDRAVPLFQTDKPIEDPLVTQIRQARLALASNDIEHSIQLIASATDTAAHLASTQ